MAGRDRQSPPTEATRAWALSAVEAAYLDGQLTHEEQDERIAGVLEADNAWRLERWVNDLQLSPELERSRPALPPVEVVGSRRPGTLRQLALAIGAVVLVGAGAGIALELTGAGDSSSTSQEGLQVDLADFRDRYRNEFGTTLVGRVQIDPEWTMVEVPVDEARRRYETWHDYGGSYSRTSAARGGSRGWLDLTDVDTNAAARNLAEATRSLGVADPSKVTVLLAVAVGSDRPQITFVVRNDFDESGRMVTDLAGEVLRTEPFVAPPGGS